MNMKLDCVLTAVNENILYLDFVPIFIKTWNKLYPNVDVKIILVSNNIPANLRDYEKNIILFKPIEKMSTAFISQYIRLLYPALLDYKNGIMITDMDILPMNRSYYTKNIEQFENDKLVYLRNVLLNSKQIAMCYNVATNKVWSEIFHIKNIEDIKNRLVDVYSSINYRVEVVNDNNESWCTDQSHLFKYVCNWNNKTNNFRILNDQRTGYHRLDRNRFILSKDIIENIKNGIYSDYHCYRPYSKYKEINDKIYECL